jgi:putative ABC transport system ATP-binding protein
MKIFELKDIKFKSILDVPYLSFDEGKVTTLLGKSGGGKTTILRLLNKMISPCSGQVLYNGTDLESLNSVNHRRNVVMLSQNPIIFQGNIRDNLNTALKFQEKPEKSDDELKDVLDRLELTKGLDENAYKLSGGEKQRLALGRILLLDSEVYLFDEPSSALDDHTEEFIIDMLVKHVKTTKKTAIMVTHSRTMANKYSDVTIGIAGGHIT